MALKLQRNPRTRRTIEDLRKDWPKRGTKLLHFVPALFSLFCCMVVLVKPMVASEPVPSAGAMTALTKEQRSELWGIGLVLHRVPTLQHRVVVAKESLRAELTRGFYVTWADQFCKSTYSKHLDAQRDFSISCTTVDVSPCVSGHPSFTGWHSAERLMFRVKDVTHHVKEIVTEFVDVVKDLGSDCLLLGLLRCPLDI